MKLDLRTVIIPDDRRMWVVHPGKNKKFFEDFEQNNRIYLEYPDLDLSPEVLNDDIELRRRIKYSLELAKYEGYVRSNGAQIRLADFEGDATTNVAVFLRTIRHMFDNMSEGDLVIVPGWGSYSRVLFGEIVGSVNFDEKTRIFPHTFADTHYRRVKWLSVTRTKPELGDLVKYVNKPPAVAEVARDRSTERFFDFAYDAYLTDARSWSTITAPTYRSNDPRAIADSVRLIEFAVASYWAMEDQADISSMTMDEVIEKFYSNRDIEHFGISYASPGRVDFKAQNRTLSIWVAVFIALASAGGLSGCKADPAGAQVMNSYTASPAVNAKIQSQIDVLVSQVSDPTIRQIESMGKKANADTGLDSPVEVKK